jgi:diguanylate cyclase
MKFPSISELVTTEVRLLDINTTLNQTIELMYEQNHRSVIVKNQERFFLVTAGDLLKLKLKNYDFNQMLGEIRLTELPTIFADKNILEAISFLEQSIEYISVVDKNNNFIGIITHTDIISNIDPETLMDNYRICDLIKINQPIFKTNKDVMSLEVLQQMVDGNLDNIIVLENSKAVGIITTKDVMKLLKSSSDLTLPIENYMTSPIETLHQYATLKDAITFMKNKHYKRVVVVDDDEDIISIILQRELISLSYSKWATLMKEYSSELFQINELLKKKTQKYEDMASTDQLTGLYNRYKFTELFISEYATMTKRKNEMSLIILDIDHFKIINDTYGHNIGDKVLVGIASILKKYFRSVDIVCRWGGEEFVVLVPTASIENGVLIAEKIRQAIENKPILEDIKITASFGITTIKIGDKLEDVVKRADEALYEAKNSGRNNVKINIK